MSKLTQKTVLVTGGAGYIGSHTSLALLEAGNEVIVVDDLSNSNEIAIRRVEELAGRQLSFYRLDLRDRKGLEAVFAKHKIDAVIHFAGSKAVGESVRLPLAYYDNNLIGTIELLKVMQSHGVKKIVFSSSATVYGTPEKIPATEDMPRLETSSPYGRTKQMIESMLFDLCVADQEFTAIMLRYFNPIGAHPSGFIGEDPSGIPNNLLPFITQVAVGRLGCLNVFGTDYPTPDGTCIRDYIHVVDLANGHLDAVAYALDHVGAEAFNLGTGNGVSVSEMVAAFEVVSGVKLNVNYAPRREGDTPILVADPSKARRVLGFAPKQTLASMCADSWKWQSQNPNGYMTTNQD